MKTKNKNPILLFKDEKLNPILEFYFELNHLKQLFRQGWIKRNIPENKVESVADHILGTSLLTLIIAETEFESLDLLKLLKMVLVHELGEIFIGDVTPSDFISKKLKHEWELKAVIELFSKIPNGREYINLWKEYEELKTREAKLVKEIDLLEAALQGIIYKLQYSDKNIEKNIPENTHIIPWTERRLKNKILLELLREAKKILPKFNQK